MSGGEYTYFIRKFGNISDIYLKLHTNSKLLTTSFATGVEFTVSLLSHLLFYCCQMYEFPWKNINFQVYLVCCFLGYIMLTDS